MKKSAIFLLPIALLLSGCAGSSNSSSQSAGTSAETTTVVAESATEAVTTVETTVEETKAKGGNTVVDNRKNKPTEPASFSESDFETESYIYENSIGISTLYVTVKNNSQATVEVEGNATVYDSSGNAIGVQKSDINVLGGGEESIMSFYFSDVKGVASSDYKLTYKAQSYYKPVIANLAVEQAINDKNLTVKVTNNGDYNAQFVQAYALFLDADNNIVYTDSKYLTDNDSEIKVGATLSGQMNCRTDFDHVNCYLTGRSDGSTTKADTSVSDSDFEIREYRYENSSGSSLYYLVVKNNGTKEVGISGNMTAYDEGGNVIGAANGDINVLAPGDESIMTFYFDSVGSIDHVDYQMSYDTAPYYSSVFSDLETNATINDKNVIVSVKNNGEKIAQFVQVYALFFDADNNLIKVDSTYAIDGDSEIKPGDTQTVQLNAWTTFDHVEYYLTGRS